MSSNLIECFSSYILVNIESIFYQSVLLKIPKGVNLPHKTMLMIRYLKYCCNYNKRKNDEKKNLFNEMQF